MNIEGIEGGAGVKNCKKQKQKKQFCSQVESGEGKKGGYKMLAELGVLFGLHFGSIKD